MDSSPAAVELRLPARLEQVLDLLAEGGWQPLAGGTDIYPAHVGRALKRPLVDVSSLVGLQGMGLEQINQRPMFRIGAAETWTRLREARLPAGLEALAQAAAEIGGRQVQNQGTLGGNLCNASPAADGVPVLLALDAEVELQSRRGLRRIPAVEFVLGNRRTALAADELLTAIHIPVGSRRARSAFLKLGHRRFLVISIAMVAVATDCDDAGRLTRCAIAVGSCSAAARRLPALESALVGVAIDQASVQATRMLAEHGSEALAPLTPIDDVRGSAHYRREAVQELIPRALAQAVSAPPGFDVSAKGNRS